MGKIIFFYRIQQLEKEVQKLLENEQEHIEVTEDFSSDMKTIIENGKRWRY